MEEKKYTVDEIVKMGTEIGIQTGIEYIRREKEQRRKSRHDKRLRNTKLLLREYRKLFIHSENAVSSWRKLNAVDILDEIDDHEFDSNLYIESITSSKERTKVIIEHVKKMMRIFKFMSYKSKKPENRRRYDIIFEMYISGKEATAEELSAKFLVDVSTIYKDINIAVEDLTSLIFGIDGLKIY